MKAVDELRSICRSGGAAWAVWTGGQRLLGCPLADVGVVPGAILGLGRLDARAAVAVVTGPGARALLALLLIPLGVAIGRLALLLGLLGLVPIGRRGAGVAVVATPVGGVAAVGRARVDLTLVLGLVLLALIG